MAMKPCQDNMRCGRGTVGRWRAAAAAAAAAAPASTRNWADAGLGDSARYAESAPSMYYGGLDEVSEDLCGPQPMSGKTL